MSKKIKEIKSEISIDKKIKQMRCLMKKLSIDIV